jgi:tetratricopeptide (TPR) repeat protein
MNRKTVSLCLIARDEEASIGMTIKSVLALVDEVIVVDTGSKDNTRIIAEGYGARILDVSWEDDFSKVRNAALNEALSDWVLVLDADEFLQPVRPVEFQRLLHDPAAAAYRLRMASPIGEEASRNPSMIRLFRNHPDIRYRYPIFEQVTESLNWWAGQEGLEIKDTDLTVVHEGGKPELKARKRKRNQRILKKAMDEYPNEPYFPYKMGCAGIQTLDDEVLPTAGLTSALGHLHTAWKRVSDKDQEHLKSLPWLPDLGVKSSSGLLIMDRLDESRTLIRRMGELFPQHPQVILQMAVVEIKQLEMSSIALGPDQSRRMVAEVRERLTDLLAWKSENNGEAIDRRLLDLYPLRYLGELALLGGHVSEAVGYFEQALSLDPDYSFGWLGMAECSRFAGDRKRALKLYLRTITENEWNHRGWLRGCDLMKEMEFLDNATTWRRRVNTQFPEHPALGRDKIQAPEPARLLHPVN